MARARLVSARGSILTSLPSTLAATSPCSATASAPLGPFTLTSWPSTLAVTPEGIATGFFPTRDMAAGPLGCLLERSLGGHARAADCTATRAPSFHIKRRYREFLRPHCCRAHRDRPSPPWVSTESQPPIRCSHAGEP